MESALNSFKLNGACGKGEPGMRNGKALGHGRESIVREKKTMGREDKAREIISVLKRRMLQECWKKRGEQKRTGNVG